MGAFHGRGGVLAWGGPLSLSGGVVGVDRERILV